MRSISTIANLMVLVDGNATPLTAALTKASASVKSFAVSGETAAAQVSSAFVTAGSVIGVALAAATLAGVSKFQEVAGEVRTLEKQLGTTAEEASVLRAQGDALGVGVDKLSVGFGILSKHLVANDAMMVKYGITTQQTADGNIDFQALLAELSAKFQALPPGMERTAMAMNLFGRSGKTLLPLLAANSSELATFAANAEKAGLIMSQDDVDAARALSIAQRELGAAFEGLEVSLARAVLPLLTTLVNSFAALVRFVSPALPLIRDISLAFVAWKAFTFIPLLLQSIALGLNAVGVAGGAAALTTAAQATAMVGLSEVLLPVAAGLGLVYTAYKILSGGDPTFVPALSAAMVEFAHNSETLGPVLTDLESKVGLAQDSIISWADSMRTKLASALGIAQQKVENFAHMTDDALKTFRSDVMSSVEASIGSLTSLGAKWSLTSRQAVNAMEAMATKAGAIGRDFRRLDDEAIPQKFQAFLLTQGPDAVHAYVGANKQGQADMLKSWKTYQANMAEIQAALVKITRASSTAIGLAITSGTAQGIAAGTPAVMAAAAAMANRAEQAAMDALGAHSPSKVMMDVGSDFTIGFAQGIESEMSTVISAIQAVVGEGLSKARLLQAKELEAMASDMASKMTRMVDAVQKDWDRLHSMIDDFKSSVRSGFDTIDILGGAQGLGQQLHDDLVSKVQAELDAAKLAQAPAEIIAALEAKLKATTDSTVVPSAADFATFLKDQLATAQQFASALTQLQSMGLNQGLLSELASQGPASLPFLQALISGGKDVISQFNDTQAAIDKIAGKTAGSLADDIFGKRLDKLGLEVENLQDRLAKMAESLADKVSTFIDAIRADAVGVKVDDVIKALDQLAKRLESFQVPGPGNGPGSSSSQSAPYVPGMAAMAAAGVTGTGLGFDFDYDQMAEAQVAAIDRRGGFHPVMVQSEHDAATSRYISKTGAGRRSL